MAAFKEGHFRAFYRWLAEAHTTATAIEDGSGLVSSALGSAQFHYRHR